MATQRKTLCLLAAIGAIGGCQILTGLNGVHVVGSGGDGGAGGAPSSSSGGGSHSTSSSTGAASTSSSSGFTSSSSSSTTSSSTSASSTSASSTAASSAASSGTGSVCGNGVTEPGEECDDSNTAPGDGCGPTCKIEHPDTCPGTPIAIATGQTIDIHDDTTGASDKFTDATTVGNCANGTFPGADLVYAVTPSTAGMLNITFTPTYTSGWLHVRDQCPGTKANEIGCHYAMSSGPMSVSVAVTKDQTYFVVADSWQSHVGAFTLSLNLQ